MHILFKVIFGLFYPITDMIGRGKGSDCPQFPGTKNVIKRKEKKIKSIMFAFFSGKQQVSISKVAG